MVILTLKYRCHIGWVTSTVITMVISLESRLVNEVEKFVPHCTGHTSSPSNSLHTYIVLVADLISSPVTDGLRMVFSVGYIVFECVCV